MIEKKGGIQFESPEELEQFMANLVSSYGAKEMKVEKIEMIDGKKIITQSHTIPTTTQ